MAALNPALTQVLAARRGEINAAVAAARHARAGFDPATFAALVRGPIDACARAVEPARAEAVAAAMVQVALDLVALGIDPIDHGPALATLAAAPRALAAAPQRVAASCLNAAARLRSYGIDPASWFVGMRACGPLAADADAWLAAGIVVAWRCGLACARAGARDALGPMEDALACAAIGLAPGATTRAALVAGFANAWWRPDHVPPGPRIAARLGDFVGFGGAFVRPPRVCAQSGHVLAGDDQRWFALHADAYGAVLIAADPPDSDATTVDPAAFAHPLGVVDATSAAWADHLVAVTTASSHRVIVVAP
ncbi:MAG TPA: hypothetical protein VEL07_03185 [Planctomycetota bacterium]|nr:hypothetical protein [Planctomycetota bacterium]